MIQIRRLLTLLLLVLFIGLAANGQTYTRSGNTFISSKGERVKTEPTKTRFTWLDSKGVEYPVYISSNGSCFIIKVSKKTGNTYRHYLSSDISMQICKELNIEYKGKKGKQL